MMDIVDEIKEYLFNGGLFNPELMEHEKVRDMIMRARTEIEKLRSGLEAAPPAEVEPVASVAQDTFGNGGVFWFKECPPDGTMLCICPQHVSPQKYDEELMTNKFLHIKLAKATLDNTELKDCITELQAEAYQYLKQRDDLSIHTVEVYKALDALLEASQECEFEDVMQKVAPIELWDDLEQALKKGE